ncbi:phosphoglycerate dehydrogenase [Staphylospora marina]|uniref:phosphoglycerate dehydrogenase n=1 Tax=Staphylospora marina TaxID=2490858 RepID=UPI000F5C2670|nr:phosphoglycerate dehydrogenase [Staphylospora marina]
MYNVLIADPIGGPGLEKLRNAGEIRILSGENLAGQELFPLVEEADALIVRSGTRVDEELLSHARRLKVIARAGVGVDNIDVNAATRRGIIVVNAPDGNTVSTAEHTFALLISMARNIPQASRSLLHGEWKRKEFTGVELSGKTLAIVGMGRIGSELAVRAKAFRMRVIAHDPYLTEERADKLGVEIVPFDEAVRQADFLSVHTPLTKETRHLINRDVLARMKEGVRIINCARGGIIDEEALLEAIRSGKVAGAALDVFEKEPPGDHPLLKLRQVVATPHLGASTVEAQQNVAEDVAEEVLNILRGKPFKNAVNLPPVPAELQARAVPFRKLAGNMGRFISALLPGPVRELKVILAGEVSDLDSSLLTRAVLSGLLARHLDRVNEVNALHLARERGIRVTEQKIPDTAGFTQQIRLEAETSHGTVTVSGTVLNGLGPRIIRVDGYSVDVAPKGHLLFIRHHDQPGAIGRVGTLLGNHGINIATMQVGRQAAGGAAIMVLRIDKPVPTGLLEELRTSAGIHSVTEIDLT